MSDIKLFYFGLRGRAEPIRLCFAASGKKFTDVRIKDWGVAEKAKAPYGQMPYIEYKGKAYGESKAVASFVARECGMAGTTPVDTMRVDEVYCLVGSLLEAMAKVHFEKDEEKKKAAGEELITKTIPKYLEFFEKLLKETGTGYFVGKGLTLADLSVQDITYSLLKQNPKVLDGFPEIQKMKKNVEGDSKVQAYLASRPDSDM